MSGIIENQSSLVWMGETTSVCADVAIGDFTNKIKQIYEIPQNGGS